MSLLDTAPAPEAETATGPSARATLTPRDLWQRARFPLVIGVGFVLVALLYAITADGGRLDRLDPDGTGPEGSRALVTLLREHGVDVRVVDEPSGAAGTTVFVPVPLYTNAIRPAALRQARLAGTLVVAEPDELSLEALDVDATVAGNVDEEVRRPACTQPDATAAGAVLLGGTTFGAPEHAVPCYVADGEAPFVELAEGGRRVTLLGSAAFMTNEHLDDDGNAALAMRLLSGNPTLEYVFPRTPSFGADEEPAGLLELLPHRLLVAIAQVFVVLLLLALWRGRRLGPVVTEPLPVVVRAAEAVEGRARLYESAHARGQAANALRAGLRDRLVRVLGLAPDASPETMVAAVQARTGRDATSVSDVLYGAPPADDAALVRLAADLDRLDNEVRAL